MLLFVNDLTVIDCAYLCDQRGIVGESWIVDLQLSGDLNAMSMVLDFGRLKKQVKRIIDEAVDHKLLVPRTNTAIVITSGDSGTYVDFWRQPQSVHLYSPNSAYAFIDSDTIDPQAVIEHLNQPLRQYLPDNVADIQITLRTEATTGYYYHYTHGLKKHDGNCQRIAHGHRSKIEIYQNGERNSSLEQQWANRWQNIYLGSAEDQVSKDSVHLSAAAIAKLADQRLFAYQAPHGEFAIAVPESESELVPCDTTVECLADYIVAQMHAQDPTMDYKVVAYEGVGKGAIAIALADLDSVSP